MLKQNPLLLICILFSFLSGAQTVKLKKQLNKEDFAFLEKELRDCIHIENDLQISYETKNVFDMEKTRIPPASMEEIKKMEAKLKGNENDADKLQEIANLYARLNKNLDAENCYLKSMSYIQSIISKYPDSAGAWCQLGAAYLKSRKYDESITAYKKAREVNRYNKTAAYVIPEIYLITFRKDSAYPYIQAFIHDFPDDKEIYNVVPLYYLYNIFASFQEPDFEENISKMNTDSLVNMPILNSYLEKNKKDFKAEYLHKVSRYVCIESITMMKSVDSTFTADHVKFVVPAAEMKMLDEGEKYFLSCLSRPELKNKYYAYKLLAGTYMLKNQFAKSAVYFRKAIEAKKIGPLAIVTNADEDYNNLASVYSALKDTANYLKTLDEKIKIKANIYPNSSDYLKEAHIYLCRKKFNEADRLFDEALEYCKAGDDNVFSEAYLGKALSFYMQDKLKEAQSCVDKAYARDKSNWKTYIFYGILSLCEGDISNSWDLFNIAKKLRPKKWIDEELLDKFFVVEDSPQSDK